MKLTASTIARLALPDGIDDRIYFDDDLKGFGLRLRRSGDRGFVVQYAIGGKTRKIRLGSVAELDISKARSTAKTLLAQVRLGGDPASEKAHARVRAGETFGALLGPFMQRQQTKLKPRSFKETQRHLQRLCKPLHALPIAVLNRRTVAARLAAIAEANGPAAANRVRGSLGAFFTWAVMGGFRDDNPVVGTGRAVENGPRNRLLSDDELATIWHGLGDDHYGTIVRLLILTGLRRGEIGELRWSEINLDAGFVTLSPERTKNGRVHVVPMSTPVRALIEAQPQQAGCDRVFAGVFWNGAKATLDKRLAEDGEPLAPWVVHDLRRAFSTALHDKFNVPPHVVETLLGHSGGHKAGVSGVYNLARYLDECRRALDRWAEHIMALVTGEMVTARVVQLRSDRDRIADRRDGGAVLI
jgi:integrase